METVLEVVRNSFYRRQRGSDRTPNPRHITVAGNPRERLFLEDDDLNWDYHEEQVSTTRAKGRGSRVTWKQNTARGGLSSSGHGTNIARFPRLCFLCVSEARNTPSGYRSQAEANVGDPYWAHR